MSMDIDTDIDMSQSQPKPQREQSGEMKRDTCLICQDKEGVWFAKPCCHFASCDACFAGLQSSKHMGVCAICRTAVQEYCSSTTGKIVAVRIRKRKREEKDEAEELEATRAEELRVVHRMEQEYSNGDRAYAPDDDEESLRSDPSEDSEPGEDDEQEKNDEEEEEEEVEGSSEDTDPEEDDEEEDSRHRPASAAQVRKWYKGKGEDEDYDPETDD